MDLSKAFDCLPHDLILLKLEAYGLSEKSINLLNSYLSGRKQCVKGLTCSSHFILLPFKSKQICSLKLFLPIAKAWNLSGLACIKKRIAYCPVT
jgi:hypothetical protein